MLWLYYIKTWHLGIPQWKKNFLNRPKFAKIMISTRMSCFSRHSSSFVNDDLVFRMKTYLWLRTSPLCSTNRTLFSSSGYFWLIKLGVSIYMTTFVFIFVQERNGGGQFTVVFAAEMWCGSLEGKWTADLRSLAPLMPPTFNGRFRLSRKQARGFQCRFLALVRLVHVGNRRRAIAVFAV